MILPTTWQLPEAILVRFGERTSGRQRAMYHEGHLLLVLDLPPERGEDERESVFFWREPNGTWHYSQRGNGLPSLREHLDAFEAREDALRAAYRRADDARDYFELLEEIAPLQNTAKNLHAALQSARESVKDDRDIIGLRDRACEVERGLDLLYRDTKNALDYSMAQRSEDQAQLAEQMAKAGHRLNILAAIFFPLAAISGIFGMNLPSGLEGAPVALFWFVLLAGMFAGVVLCIWILQRPVRKADPR